MAIYQWLLRELGHPVSTRGFFVYENGNNDAESLLSEGTDESPRGIPLKPALIEIDIANEDVIIEGERIDLDWVENLVISAKIVSIWIQYLKQESSANNVCVEARSNF